ncbi:MAG: sensor histidine kinase [Solirubrobacteraceae bacterium]
MEDALLIARAEAGALEARREPLALAEIVAGAAHDAEGLARSAGVELALDVPGDPVHLEGDPGQLRRVLDNLLSKAVKYSPAGGPVDVRLRIDRSTALVEVADGGIGMPPAEVDHLFTRFFRASTARARNIPGTGLGLAICRSIVAAHEGTITVESAVGAGTTVRVRLPLARR